MQTITTTPKRPIPLQACRKPDNNTTDSNNDSTATTITTTYLKIENRFIII